MSSSSLMPDLISQAQASEEQFLRQIFVRDQMAEWSRQPLIMARADGIHYWDTSGKRYLDALSGIYVVAVGHNNRRVIEAIRDQLDRLHFSPPMHGTNPVAVQLANLLAELAPGDLSAVKFQCGGAEITEAAIKLARQYHRLNGNPGKYKIISRYQSWHGSTLGSLSASGLKSRRTVNEPLAPGFLHVFPPTCYRCPFGKEYPDCGITCATIVESVIDMEDPSTVAAIMVEPIGHTGGVIDPPDEYLPILRDICDRHNILLIFDEIITGIGRTGRMFAAETFGVTPDVLCIAKGMSGGYAPISAMICRERIARAFWGPIAENPGFVEGHTFEGNPRSQPGRDLERGRGRRKRRPGGSYDREANMSTILSNQPVPAHVSASAVPCLYRLSVQQYEAMAEAGIFSETDRVELIQGLLVIKMTKNPPHSVAARAVAKSLGRLVPQAFFVTREDPIRIPGYSE